MKNLSNYLWKQAYGVEPQYYCRYWVQLWLELLDSGTDYLFDLETTDLPYLLNELVETPNVIFVSKKPQNNYRTLFYLICEIQHRLKEDAIWTQLFTVHLHCALQAVIEGLAAQGRTLFCEDGTEKNLPARVEKLQVWSANLDAARSGVVGTAVAELNLDSTYPAVLCRMLTNELAHGIPPHDIEHENRITALTSGLLYDLLTRRNFAASFLVAHAEKVFLEINHSAVFLERLQLFFSDLVAQVSDFDIFMRLQARKELRQLQYVGNVEIYERLPEMIVLIERLADAGRMEREDVYAAKQFFFEGADSERIIFAVVRQVQGPNVASAAAAGVRELELSLQRARFEFELSSFSLDNRLYVLNRLQDTFEPFTKRQAVSMRYGRAGRTERLNLVLDRLEQVAAREGLPKSLRKKVTDMAMQWHQQAMDAVTPEARFINHWTGVEQLLKEVTSIQRSSGDLVVLALAPMLGAHYLPALLTNLWGDLVRCNLLGMHALASEHTGTVRYEPRLNMRLNFATRITAAVAQPSTRGGRLRSEPPDIAICSKYGALEKTYYVPDGFQVFVRDGQVIHAGDLICGPVISHDPDMTNLLTPLFQDLRPHISNVARVLRYYYDSIRMLEEGITALAATAGFTNTLPAGKLQQMVKFEQHLHRLASENDQMRADLNSPDLDLVKLITLWQRRHASEWEHMEPVDGTLGRVLRHLEGVNAPCGDVEIACICLWNLAIQLSRFWCVNVLPSGVVIELYRNQTPYWSVILDGLRSPEWLTNLVQLSPDQALLQSRIRQVRYMAEHPRPVHHYIWELDRMRRTRNDLVHNANAQVEMGLLSRRLYQWSRLYLAKVFERLAFAPYSGAESVLTKWPLGK